MTASPDPAARKGQTERRARIVAELRANPAVRVAELARAFGVSTETIRRDLDALSDRGLVSRTYGGAAAVAVEPSLARRARDRVEPRERIARRGVELVERQQVILIDCGSTTLHLGRRLAADRDGLTVVTNAPAIAAAVAANPSNRAVLCPGDYSPREGGVFGPETLAFLRRFHADLAVIGASGLTAEGVTEVQSGAAWVKRAMLERARRRVLLVDQTKFQQARLEVVCPLDRIDDLVTDAPPPPELATALREAGVRLHLA